LQTSVIDVLLTVARYDRHTAAVWTAIVKDALHPPMQQTYPIYRKTCPNSMKIDEKYPTALLEVHHES
jgi:hypothetical protein